MLSLPLLLVLWQVVAMAVADPLLPSPRDVAVEIWNLAHQGSLPADLGQTLGRVAIAFVLAMVLGTGIGIALGRARWADRLFSAWLVVGLNLPAIVVAILFYIWLGLTEWALIGAVVVNKVPMVAVTIREGVRSFASQYDELALVSRLGWSRRLKLIYWPQLVPFVLASARAGLSLIWKIVLVIEVLGSDGGIGFRIAIFFQYFDVAGILAYTVSFVAVVLLFEYGVLRPLEGRLARWRPLRA